MDNACRTSRRLWAQCESNCVTPIKWRRHHADISSADSFASVFPLCPRSYRYGVKNILSRLKKCDRTKGGNASAPHAHRASNAVARVDVTQLKFSTDKAARDLLIFPGVSIMPPVHFNAELRRRSAEAPVQSFKTWKESLS